MTTSRPGLELAVGLDDDAAAQVVEHQRLVRLGQAEFPRDAGVLDAGERRGAGAAVVAADEHHVGMRLGHAGRDGADADLGDQLDADARLVVGVLQVVDQLAPGPRWSRCRGAAAARSGRRPASSGGPWRSTDRPCCPGSWPPSPGLAPWAILICSSWALTR